MKFLKIDLLQIFMNIIIVNFIKSEIANFMILLTIRNLLLKILMF